MNNIPSNEFDIHFDRLNIKELKIGDLVRAVAVRTPEHEAKRTGIVHLIAKALVYDDAFYVGDEILELVKNQIESGEDPRDWDLQDVLDNQLEFVVMLRLEDNSFWAWWNQSFTLLKRAGS
jgi:hypothetical protein